MGPCRTFLLLFLPCCLICNPGNYLQDSKDLKAQQSSLMDFVADFSRNQPIDEYKKALRDIRTISRKINNGHQVLSFCHGLLESIRYRRLYSSIFLCIAEFHIKKKKEHFLSKALTFSLTSAERQAAVARLYEFFKANKMKHLELSFLQRLIEIQKKTGDRIGLEKSFFELGLLFRESRDYLTALKYLFEAVNSSNHHTSTIRGRILLNISQVFTILDRNELARKYLKRAMDYTIHYGDDSLRILILRDYSSLSLREGQLQRALQYINSAINHARKLKKHTYRMFLYYQKSLVMMEMNRLPDALFLLENALEHGIRYQNHADLLPVLTEFAEKLIQSKNYTKAAQCLEQMDDLYAPYYTYYFFYYFLKAIYYEAKNEWSQSLQFYNQTMTALDKYFSSLMDQRFILYRSKIIHIYSRAITFYLKMFEVSEDTRYITKAVYFSEVKNSYTYDLVTRRTESYSHLHQEKKRIERELEVYSKYYLQALKNKRDRETLAFFEYKLDSLRGQYTELDEMILEMPYRFKKYRFENVNLARIQEKLGSSQMILKYTVLKDNTYGFIINRDSIGFYSISTDTGQLVKMVKDLTEPLDDFTRGKVDYLRIHYDLELAHRLYQILLQEILKGHPGKKEIFIIPDGQLFKLPFEALVSGFNDKGFSPNIMFSEYGVADYLIQNYKISYLLSLFHFLEPPPRLRAKKIKVSAFGNPKILAKYPTEALSVPRTAGQLREIPSSASEIMAIRDIYGKSNVEIFLNQRFNKSNFESFAPRSEIIHLATHFFSNHDYPQHSALLFSAGQEQIPFYYAHQIFDLKLNGSLVVLSACESSEKNLLGLQGLRGMTAAFKQAGARAIIASMWPVDEHSSQIVPVFYQHYWRCQDFVAALRSAKLELMQTVVRVDDGLKLSFYHPFLWANFIVLAFCR